MGINERITKVRNNLGYSQDEVANKLGMSRQTYIKVEKGEVYLDTNQLSKLSDFYGINITEFFYENQNIEKFKQMCLFILNKFKNKGVSKTKLAKLLYLCDFKHFYDHLEPMSNISYTHKEYGPLASPFLDTIDDFYEKGKITINCLSEGAQMIDLSQSNIDLKFDLLSDIEKKEIEQVCKKWEKSNTQEIVNFTHNQKPWMASRENEKIPYELILQEDPKNVF